MIILTITNVPAGSFMRSRMLANIPKVEQPEDKKVLGLQYANDDGDLPKNIMTTTINMMAICCSFSSRRSLQKKIAVFLSQQRNGDKKWLLLPRQDHSVWKSLKSLTFIYQYWKMRSLRWSNFRVFSFCFNLAKFSHSTAEFYQNSPHFVNKSKDDFPYFLRTQCWCMG